MAATYPTQPNRVKPTQPPSGGFFMGNQMTDLVALCEGDALERDMVICVQNVS